MTETTSRVFLCKVQNCPMEGSIADNKSAFDLALKETFGNDMKVAKCERVDNSEDGALYRFNTDEKTYFCEMLIKTDGEVKRQFCPKGFQIIMEVSDDVL